MKIPISEIFESIQWEWRLTWKPSIFVRFWGCNLKCDWCDSKYSWDSKVEKADMMELRDVIKKIKSFKSKHIIFTWWEPTLYQKEMIAIQDILIEYNPKTDLYDNLDYTFELETNWSKKITEEVFFQQINISPKLKSSWNKKYELEIFNGYLSNAAEGDYFNTNIDLKFVCSNLIDTKETDEYIEYMQGMKNQHLIDNVYIMPKWRDNKSQVNDFLLKYCIANWYNYCLRQHLILFWDGKGK